ncbi:hypothetical protein AGMMS49928_13380 [Spirochaetia bacterium]|nr:hypothetical protein AGMMS49928_13380 [Spirochaetia bacterium]
MKKRILMAIIAAVAVVGAANAQVTISGGLALGSAEYKDSMGSSTIKGDVGIGGNIYLDYVLPIGVPMSLGIEAGIDTSTFKDTNKDSNTEDVGTAIPILLRVAYHFDLASNLDLYLVGKIGYAFNDFTGDTADYMKSVDVTLEMEGGIAFGIDLGVCFYFTPLVGIFAEAGYDQYNGKVTAKFNDYYSGSSSETIDTTFNRFFTAGLSIKF